MTQRPPNLKNEQIFQQTWNGSSTKTNTLYTIIKKTYTNSSGMRINVGIINYKENTY